MFDFLPAPVRDALTFVGFISVVVTAGLCVLGYLAASVPRSSEWPKLDDPRDKQSEWDRIQGR